jgi:hypothetical protein
MSDVWVVLCVVGGVTAYLGIGGAVWELADGEEGHARSAAAFMWPLYCSLGLLYFVATGGQRLVQVVRERRRRRSRP